MNHPRNHGGSGLESLFKGLLVGCGLARTCWANPDGMTVVQGGATSAANGTRLSIQVTQPSTVLDWRSFNIAPGETTTFHQPSAASIVWNRINDVNPSQIWGNLNANGYVVLYNQNGFYFGPGSVITVGGLVATTSAVVPPEIGAGGLWQYAGPPPAASIVNYGTLRTHSGGDIYLIAEQVENHGVISAPEGNVGLYGGKEVMLSERPDGRGLTAQVRLPDGAVDNQGKIIADAGTISLQARVVNQNGLLQANSVRERQGVIELVASEEVRLGSASTLEANGGPEGPSAGGRITIQSQGLFKDDPDSTLSVRGGAAGGDGGNIEVSAVRMSGIESRFAGAAGAGFKGGALFIDPTDIILGNNGGPSGALGTVNPEDPPEALRLNVNANFAGFSQITLRASRDISLEQGVQWDLAASTGILAPGSVLTLEAGRNIVFADNSKIVAGAGWSVSLTAGADFAHPGQAVNGVGGIYFNGLAPSSGASTEGNGSLETSDGWIHLTAGNEILIGSGYVRSVGGGDIRVTTLAGDVDAGSKPDFYDYTRLGYRISAAGLGGIGTAQGGDVTIESGRDILSYLPTMGAFGGGDVTLTAQRNVFGNFLIKDGQGSIVAGNDIGSSASPVSLDLIKGSWHASAQRDLYLNEVRNPNGTFNSNKLTTGARIPYQFDYDPEARVVLKGGNSVQLLGSSLPRTGNNRDLPPVYPPSVEVEAGAGGVVLGNDVVQYPSAQGTLKVTITDGGSLRSADGQYHQWVMSDSGDPHYATFATDHAATPLHANDGTGPVTFDIAGDVQNVLLRMPKETWIDIGGSALNFSFAGQNLSPSDNTRISIHGDCVSRSDRTFEVLDAAPDFSVFDPQVSRSPELGARLTYDPVTHQLGFQGKMTPAERDELLHPQVYVLDVTGSPVLNAQGNPVLVPAVFTADTAAIEQLYARSQDIPTSALAYQGIQIGGPGRLTLEARNLDLGISKGVRSVGPLDNPSLAGISAQGSELDVTLRGDLTMISSQIASFGGGAIRLQAAGSMNIGSQQQFTSDDTPKGVFTTSGGDIQVIAGDAINVNGSRIATYNGGNIEVNSLHGDVNAGEGGLGAVSIYRTEVDPQTGQVRAYSTTIPGSGILATTLPGSSAPVGDIAVTAARDVIANKGGIIQLAFGKESGAASSITVKAGRNIDASNSGILGGNVSLDAQNDISGLVIASHNIAIQALANVNVTAVAQGGVSVNAGGAVSGSIVGGGSVSVSGEAISAALISQNVSAAGDASAAKVGVSQSAPARSDAKITADASETLANKPEVSASSDLEDPKKNHAKPALTKYVGRVTVILPKP